MTGKGSNTAESTPAADPLVGRARETARVTQAIEEALAGRGRLLLIVGDAGMGKTTLCRRIAEEALQREFTVARGSTWETVDAPAFWPWIQALRQLEGSDEPILFGEPEDRFKLFDGVASALLESSAHIPLVVVLEDLHAADESTLVLLRFVERAVASSRILLVGTYDEREASTPGRPGSLLAELAHDADVLHLGPLDEESVTMICQQIADGPLSESFTRSIHEASEGNPLFASEAIRVLTAKGDIHRPDYSIGFRVPQGLKGMIRRRLEGLSEEVVAILSIASILGRQFDVSLLQQVAGAELDPLLDLLDDAVAAGVIEESGALGRYAFAHIMVRETLYEELTSARRMKLHRLAAEALERAYGGDVAPRLPELAHHWFKSAQAGDPRKAMDYTRRAAAAAEEQGAPEEAIRLYKRALKVAQSTGRPGSEIEELRAALSKAGEEARNAPATRTDGGTSRFKKEGDYWTMGYEGAVTRLKDAKGLRHIHVLLSNPGREIHVLELMHLDAGSALPAPAPGREDGLRMGTGDVGAILDPVAKARYKARLDGLHDEIQEAETFNDPERTARAQQEVDALTQELARALGLGGRDRKAASEAERARVTVQKAVKDALRRITAALPSLGDHLAATLRTGTFCRYEPDPRAAVDWELR